MKTFPPKPASRPAELGLAGRIRAFRKDLFRSQPERLYSARIARSKTPFFNSFFVNDPEHFDDILAMPKSPRVGQSLRPLLGNSVFVTNGATWAGQRRIIDPAFSADRVKDFFPAILGAGQDAATRWQSGRLEVEFACSYLAADVIFRALFSLPITQARAACIYDAFRAYQRAQPLLTLARQIMKVPTFSKRNAGAKHAGVIRAEIETLVAERQDAIARGDAPDDLATRLMTTVDPETGKGFSREAMVDQVSIFFLAGHETSASVLSWCLYCLAQNTDAQTQARAEVLQILGGKEISYSAVRKLAFVRDVWREALRLFPAVPVLVREVDTSKRLLHMGARKGDMAMISPWYAQRSPRQWEAPDAFDPWRWGRGEKGAFIPFSKGPRVCPGAGLANLEGMVILALLLREFEFGESGAPPVPVAHLTVRSEAGIYLDVKRRRTGSGLRGHM